MKKTIGLLVLSTALCAFSQESEKVAPFQVSILPNGLGLEESTTHINGVVVGLWSENPQSALSVSLFNGATGNSKGIQIGLLNYSENYSGIQWGIINKAYGDFNGWQDGGINYVAGMLKGVQTGFLNVADEMRGVQLGLLNMATELYGVQIGVFNVNSSNKFFTEFPNEVAPAMILVNWKF